MKATSSVFLVLTPFLALAGCSSSDAPFGGGTVTVQAGGSVQAAIDAAASGATIELAPGRYTERLTISRSMTLKGGPGVTIAVAGSKQSFPDDSSDASDAALVIRNTGNVMIENLVFEGPHDGIQIRSSNDVVLSGVTASNNGDDGVDVRGSRDVSISGVFNGNGDKGVQIREGSTGVTVNGSEITGNVGNGVRIRDTADSLLQSSTVSGNGDDGVEIRDSSGIEVVGNTITSNAEYGVRITNAADTILDNNTISGNTDGDVRRD